MTMHAGHDNDGVIRDSIEDPVWEPSQQGPPRISMNQRIQGGVCSDVLKCGLKGRQELIAEAATLPLVP